MLVWGDFIGNYIATVAEHRYGLKGCGLLTQRVIGDESAYLHHFETSTGMAGTV